MLSVEGPPGLPDRLCENCGYTKEVVSHCGTVPSPQHAVPMLCTLTACVRGISHCRHLHRPLACYSDVQLAESAGREHGISAIHAMTKGRRQRDLFLALCTLIGAVCDAAGAQCTGRPLFKVETVSADAACSAARPCKLSVALDPCARNPTSSMLPKCRQRMP